MSAVVEQAPYRRREVVSVANGSRADKAASATPAAVKHSLANPALAKAAHWAVRDVMTPSPTCIDAGSSVIQLVRIVHTKKFRHLLVVDSAGKLVGVVSDRDLVRCFGPGEFPDERLLERLQARDIMSADVVHVTPETTVSKCIELMLAHGINCLPVAIDGRPVGILTTADLLRLLQRLL